MLGTSFIAADGVVYLYYVVAWLGLCYRAVYNTSSSDFNNIILSFYSYSLLLRYRLLLLFRYIVVLLKIPLPTIVIVGYIAKL